MKKRDQYSTGLLLVLLVFAEAHSLLLHYRRHYPECVSQQDARGRVPAMRSFFAKPSWQYSALQLIALNFLCASLELLLSCAVTQRELGTYPWNRLYNPKCNFSSDTVVGGYQYVCNVKWVTVYLQTSRPSLTTRNIEKYCEELVLF